jgi:hypothetical protein
MKLRLSSPHTVAIARKDLGEPSSMHLATLDIEDHRTFGQHFAGVMVWGSGEGDAQQRAEIIMEAVNREAPQRAAPSALAEAYKTISALVPATTTVSIDLQCWFRAPDAMEPEFRISLLPGLDGSGCNQWSGRSLAEALDAFLAAERQRHISSATEDDVEAVVEEAVALALETGEATVTLPALDEETDRVLDAELKHNPAFSVNDPVPDDDIPF